MYFYKYKIPDKNFRVLIIQCNYTLA